MSGRSLTVAIHQPEYFPWPGYLQKAKQADVFVVLDNTQFDRSSLQHRAKILAPNGPTWLTIPFVHRFPQRLDEVRFADARWPTKHRKSIQAAYARAPGFRAAAERLDAFFLATFGSVLEVALTSVTLLLEAFRVDTPVVRASTLAAHGEKQDLVMSICEAVGADRYLSGRTGATYLDPDRMRRAGVELLVQQYSVPEYPRSRAVPPDQLRGLSALDAWLHLGDDVSWILDEHAPEPEKAG